MNPKLKSWITGLFVVAAVIALFVIAQRHLAKSSLPGGAQQVAPDFALPDLSRKTVTLSSYRGKVVLLDFWATWCEPCREETPHFVDLQNKYGPQGLQILGVSMDDSPEPVRDFAQQFHVNYPLVMGTAKTGQIYGGILGLPVIYLIDREGYIRARHIGATDMQVFDKEISNLLTEPISKQ
jgi:peroxiredoxin